MVLLFALFTAFVATRQVLLHVIPGTGTYGSAILGYHLYTWSLIIALAVIIYSTIIFSFSMQYRAKYNENKVNWKNSLLSVTFIMIILLTFANIINVFLECGIMECPDNPVNYKIKL